MKKYLEITANLSSTVMAGRYTVSSKEYNIVKSTPKTIVIQKERHKERIMKDSLMKTTSDFSNNCLQRLQFRIKCLEEDCAEATYKLEATVNEKIIELKKFADNAIEAFENRKLNG